MGIISIDTSLGDQKMTSLQKFVDQNQATIEQSMAAIADLQRQLTELQQTVRVQQQVATAQRTASKEVEALLGNTRKLFKDLCSVFPKEALKDLAEEFQTMAGEVISEYEKFSQSSRFLQGSDEEVEVTEPTPQAKDFPLIVEAMPPEDDDEIPLTASQVEQVLSQWDESTLDFLKQQLGLNGRIKRLSAIAQKIAENQLSHKSLKGIREAAKLTATWRNPVLSNTNGGLSRH
jgi:hypothetical protein